MTDNLQSVLDDKSNAGKHVYCGLTSFRTISSETSSADATYAQES